MMNEAFLCPNCHFPYSPEERVPLVLHCGHSLCMLCAFAALSTAERRLPCLRCGSIQAASPAAVKDLPVNRTLLEAFGLRSDSRPPDLFESPRNFDSPRQFDSLRILDQFTTSSPNRLLFSEPEYHSAVPLTSPTTAAIKCRRADCTNDRYYFQGKVFDYCSLLCEQKGHFFVV